MAQRKCLKHMHFFLSPGTSFSFWLRIRYEEIKPKCHIERFQFNFEYCALFGDDMQNCPQTSYSSAAILKLVASQCNLRDLLIFTEQSV